MGHSRPHFLFIFVFSTNSFQHCSIKVTADWIRTQVIWHRKQLRWRLCHATAQIFILLFTASYFSSFSSAKEFLYSNISHFGKMWDDSTSVIRFGEISPQSLGHFRYRFGLVFGNILYLLWQLLCYKPNFQWNKRRPKNEK